MNFSNVLLGIFVCMPLPTFAKTDLILKCNPRHAPAVYDECDFVSFNPNENSLECSILNTQRGWKPRDGVPASSTCVIFINPAAEQGSIKLECQAKNEKPVSVLAQAFRTKGSKFVARHYASKKNHWESRGTPLQAPNQLCHLEAEYPFAVGDSHPLSLSESPEL